jgi:hypothetical protein
MRIQNSFGLSRVFVPKRNIRMFRDNTLNRDR